jgi:DNA-directed RNA polymerase subunit RPC12/RpoP
MRPILYDVEMITVTYVCQQCEKATRASLEGTPASVACTHCGAKQPIDVQAIDGRRVSRCVICPSSEMYVRKDFSQPLGLSIIVSGFIAASIAWFLHYSVATFAILVATALLDALLYLVTGNALHCYRCHSELRGLDGLDDHNPFDLEVFEKHRQQAARLKSAAAASPNAPNEPNEPQLKA